MTRDAVRADTDAYRQLAENLVRHHTFGLRDVPTAFRPPLYPLMLAPCVAMGDYSRLAIGLLHLGLGVGTVALVLLLARSWGLDRRAAAVAALLVACDPILLRWSTQLMTETLAAFLVVAGLLALTWTGQAASEADVPSAAKRAVVAGAVWGLAGLCRPALLLLIAPACVALWFINRRDRTASGAPGQSRLRRLLAAGYLPLTLLAGAAVVVSPWGIRNQVQFGRPIITTTHGGYTLLLANNPEFYRWLRSAPWGSVWQADRFNAAWDRRKPADELAADRQAYVEARETIHSEPGTFVYACLVRLGRFWSPLPHQVSASESSLGRFSRWGVALWYSAEFALALIFLVSLPHRGLGTSVPSRTWLWGLLLVVTLTFVHTFYWTDMRMRAPVMPVVALAAAGFFSKSPGASIGAKQSSAAC